MIDQSFNWEAFRPSLLRDLRDTLGLGRRKPLLALQGAVRVPDEEFIKRSWTVLRDRWLATDATLRRSVINELRVRRIGDDSLPLGSAASEVAYLRSCRNTKGLRSVVLSHLLAAGCGGSHATPKALGTGPRSRRARPSVQSDDRDWTRFSRNLALGLAQLEVDQFLILEARRHPAYYVQVAQQGPSGVWVECVSNRFLEDFEKLDEEAESRLAQLGWSPPAAELENKSSGSPNWHRGWELPVPYQDVAELVSTTLQHVYELSNPGLLAYRAFERGGPPIILPNLGIVRSPEPAKARAQPPATQALTREALQETVKKAIAAKIGGNDVEVDADGDIPLATKTVQLYVRVQADAPVVSVFGPLVWNCGDPADIHATVNEMNEQLRFGRVISNNGAVTIAADTLGDPFDSEALWNNVTVLTNFAERHIPLLQERYGGRVPFGPALPAKDQPTGGYL